MKGGWSAFTDKISDFEEDHKRGGPPDRKGRKERSGAKESQEREEDSRRGTLRKKAEDRQLEEDDMVGEDELKSTAWKKGKKAFTRGQRAVAENKEKYTIEWRGKLEKILTDEDRAQLQLREELGEEASRGLDDALQEFGPKVPRRRTRYTTTIGLRSPVLGTPVPKGTSKWKYLGKPGTKDVQKLLQKKDVSKQVKAIDVEKTTKSGNAKTFEEARKEWVNWAQRHNNRKHLIGQSVSRKGDARLEFEKKQGTRMQDLAVVDDTHILDPCRTKEFRRQKREGQRVQRRAVARERSLSKTATYDED